MEVELSDVEDRFENIFRRNRYSISLLFKQIHVHCWLCFITWPMITLSLETWQSDIFIHNLIKAYFGYSY